MNGEVDGGRFVRNDAVAAVVAVVAGVADDVVVNVVAAVETEALFDAADIVVHDVLAVDTVACVADIVVVETVADVELLGHLICGHRFVRTLPVTHFTNLFHIRINKADFIITRLTLNGKTSKLKCHLG